MIRPTIEEAKRADPFEKGGGLVDGVLVREFQFRWSRRGLSRIAVRNAGKPWPDESWAFRHGHLILIRKDCFPSVAAVAHRHRAAPL
jgi:hypothetical protein